MKNLYRLFFLSDALRLKINILYIIFFSPIIIMSIQAILVLNSSTWYYLFYTVLRENGPVEILTFLIFLIGGIFGLIFLFKNLKKMNKLFIFFYFIFSIFLILIAMEEISWGQWFFNFETPDHWKTLNFQGETNLHNLNGLQNHSDTFCLIYGIAGIVGILLRNSTFFKMIGVPIILLPWFLIITLHSIVDVLTDYYFTSSSGFLYILERNREVIELLIAMSAFLYLWLNKRKFDTSKII